MVTGTLSKREQLYKNRKWTGVYYHRYAGIFVPEKYKKYHSALGGFIEPVIDAHELLTR